MSSGSTTNRTGLDKTGFSGGSGITNGFSSSPALSSASQATCAKTASSLYSSVNLRCLSVESDISGNYCRRATWTTMLVVSVITGQITVGAPMCAEQDTGDCCEEFWL